MSEENEQGFDALGLNDVIKKACKKLGFDAPTEIQKLAIPVLLSGRDVTGIAQTGTGKTAAFALPMLNNLLDLIGKERYGKTFGLILCPTRELAIQSANAIGTYAAASNMHSVEILPVYGGAPITTQMKAIKHGVDIIVATPGRLIDLIDRRAVDLSTTQFVVLDEADEMLKMGFTEDVDKILSMANPGSSQKALFSATMPKAIEKICEKHQNNPQRIQAQKVSSTALTIEQKYAVVPFPKKTEATRRLILASNAKAVVVFVKTRSTATSVSEDLTNIGIPSVVISGDVAQKERERIVEGMRKGKIRVLIATDVAARGLDIPQIELVVNYDLPMENESYVHRIGRTGRAGREGVAVSLINPREGNKLKSIEKLIGQDIQEMQIPTLSEISKAQAVTFLKGAALRLKVGKLDNYEKPVVKALQGLESETELINYVSALVALAVHDKGEAEEDNVKFGEKFQAGQNDKGDRFRKGRNDKWGSRGDRNRKPSASKFADNRGRRKSSRREDEQQGSFSSGKRFQSGRTAGKKKKPPRR
ncbi:MAG: DEAD/DEAH box helicase [Candidatus Ancillula sp.]|jgi:ATP-dependent RNA helicase DeaD|nr:DEAD/DEAH box helicase [Candidatus Ancillula sp.]